MNTLSVSDLTFISDTINVVYHTPATLKAARGLPFSVRTVMEDLNKWSIDKRIPVPAIIAGAVFLLLQTGFLYNVIYRVGALEDFAKAQQPQAAQIAVMQEKITTVQTTLNKIEVWLQALRGPPQPRQ